jgi:hypothetical protein
MLPVLYKPTEMGNTTGRYIVLIKIKPQKYLILLDYFTSAKNTPYNLVFLLKLLKH